MRKTNNLTKRNLMENGIYTRDLQYVTIEVWPEDDFIYEEKNTIDTVDFIVKRKTDNDTINGVYDVAVADMKKVLNYLVEIYAPENYFERHVIEFGNIMDNRCIENYKATI